MDNFVNIIFKPYSNFEPTKCSAHAACRNIFCLDAGNGEICPPFASHRNHIFQVIVQFGLYLYHIKEKEGIPVGEQ